MPGSSESPSSPVVADSMQPARIDWQQLGLSLSAGLTVALLVIAILISLAALIFVGPLAPFVANGIGLLLVGTCIMNIVFALLSSQPAMIIYAQDAPALIVALLAANIAATVPAGSAALYPTVVAAIVTTTLTTGAVCVLLGQLRLGSLVRYLPYPVIGGFLAGAGWLLLLGGVGVMANTQLGLSNLVGLLRVPVLWRWLPGLLFAVILLLTLRRSRHALLLPGMLLAVSALFFAWLALSGTSLAQAQAEGLLLGPFSSGASWAPLTPAQLGLVQWPAIMSQLGTIATAAAITVIGLLLNVSGLQLARRQDFDLNRELRAAGLAQLVAGLGSSLPGFHSLSLSTISYAMGNRTRIVGIVTGLACGAAFVFGFGLIALLPRLVIGGLICYLGLSFLVQWLYDAFATLPRLDYALILVILTLIAVFGMLPGVSAGLAIAVALFVMAYSKVDVVKHALNGSSSKSRVTRSYDAQELLKEQGAQTAIFQLQGFLFFGTAHELYERVRQRALDASQQPLRFVLLDFALVPRLDATALLSFVKMLQLAETCGLTLLFAQLRPEIQQQIERALQREAGADTIRIFPDQDRALEWCENELLRTADAEVGGEQDVLNQLLRIAPEAGNLAELLAYFERRAIKPGDYLIHPDEPPDDMFFIEAGQVTAQIEGPDGRTLRLETMRGGRAVGELGFYLGRRRTAAVIADEAGFVYRITRADLQRLEQENPAAASTFHLLIARLLSERVVHLIDTVDALRR